MQITLKSAVLAALAVGGAVAAAGAQAATISITSPTAGTGSQLVFWVNDQSTSTTYADVLTQSVGSVFTPPGNGAAGTVNTYTGTASFNVGVGSDSNLVTFINNAEAAGNILTWGITAGATTNSGAGTNTIVATGSGANAPSDSYSIAKASLPSAIVWPRRPPTVREQMPPSVASSAHRRANPARPSSTTATFRIKPVWP
jgi:hypothetical protein